MRHRAAQLDLALVHELDDLAELAVLKAAAADVQLLGRDDELVDLVRRDAEPHRHHAGGVPRRLARAEQAALHAGRVDGLGGAVAAGQLLRAGHEVLIFGVDDRRGPVLQGLVQLGLVDIRHDDAVGLEEPDDAKQAAPQRPRADDEHVVLGLKLGAAATLHRNRGGLNHHRVPVLQKVRQRVAVLLRHGHELTVAAVDVDAADRQVLTDVGPSLAAGVAPPAGCHLIDDDAVAGLARRDAGANLHDLAHNLVPDDARVGRGGVRAVVNAHVGAADAGRLNLHQHVVLRVDDGLLHVDNS